MNKLRVEQFYKNFNMDANSLNADLHSLRFKVESLPDTLAEDIYRCVYHLERMTIGLRTIIEDIIEEVK